MSEGLKVGLLFGGVAVVGYLLYRQSTAPVASTTTTTTGSSTGALQTILGPSPGSTVVSVPPPGSQQRITVAQAAARGAAIRASGGRGPALTVAQARAQGLLT